MPLLSLSCLHLFSYPAWITECKILATFFILSTPLLYVEIQFQGQEENLNRAGGEGKNQDIREWNPVISHKCYGLNICILLPNSHVEVLTSNVSVFGDGVNKEVITMRSLCTTTKSSPRSPQLEKACAQQRRPNTAKIK